MVKDCTWFYLSVTVLVSSAHYTHHPLLPPGPLTPAGEVSEAALVRDILYVFQGIDGKFIKMSAQDNCYKIDSKVLYSSGSHVNLGFQDGQLCKICAHFKQSLQYILNIFSHIRAKHLGWPACLRTRNTPKTLGAMEQITFSGDFCWFENGCLHHTTCMRLVLIRLESYCLAIGHERKLVTGRSWQDF